jgi:hypothetical protein
MKNVIVLGYLGLSISACVVNAAPANPPPASTPPAEPAPVAAEPAPAAPATTSPTTTAPVAAADAGAPTSPAGTNAGSAAEAKIEVKPYAEAAEPSEAPKDAKWTVAEGRPKDYKAGVPESFWIWQDAKGNGWHMRMSTKEHLHRFNGFLAGDANLKNVKTTKTEWGDRLKAKDKRAAFDFYVAGGADGVDFNTEPNGCVRFYLLIDGKPADPARIHLGKDGAHPEKAHFKLCK